MPSKRKILSMKPSGKLRTDPVKTCSDRICKDFINRVNKDGFVGLKPDGDQWAYKYNVRTPAMNTDPFVRKCLKQFDYEYYQGLAGWTKTPDLRTGLEDLNEYNTQETSYDFIFKDERMAKCYTEAVDEAMSVFCPKDRVLPILNIEDAVDSLSHSSSAGFSFPGCKKSEVVQETFDLSRYMMHQLRRSYPIWVPPAKLAFRGHLSEESDKKVRPVWVFPAEITTMEAMFAHEYYKFLESDVKAVHFGPDAIPRLRERLTRVLRDGESEVTLDWSKFDKNIPTFLIDAAFDIIQYSFSQDFSLWTDLDGNLSQYPSHGWIKVFNFCRGYFKNTRIMLPNGDIFRKNHGIPSGSMFTQAIGSICNYIMILTLCKYHKIDISDLSVLGDDSHFLTHATQEQIAEVIPSAKYFFGMKLNMDKLNYANNSVGKRTYLGYTFNGCKLIRDTREWFLRALHSEYDVQNVAVSASRMLGLYLIGGNNDPSFDRFLRYWFGCYPQVIGQAVPVSKEVERIFKYVFHVSTENLFVPDIRQLHPIASQIQLTLRSNLIY